jgi:hypothetical protein
MGLGLGVELTELSVSSFTLLLGSFSFLSLSLLCLCSCLCLCLCLCFFLSFFFFFNLPLSDLCFESPSFLNIPGSNPTGPLCPIPGSDTELSEKYSCLGVGLGGSICMSIGSSCITTLNPNKTQRKLLPSLCRRTPPPPRSCTPGCRRLLWGWGCLSGPAGVSPRGWRAAWRRAKPISSRLACACSSCLPARGWGGTPGGGCRTGCSRRPPSRSAVSCRGTTSR